MAEPEKLLRAISQKGRREDYEEILELLKVRGPSAEFHALSRELDDLKKQLSRAHKEIGRLKGKPIVEDARELTRRFERLERGMGKMYQNLDAKETDLTPTLQAINKLEGQVQAFTEAVQAIKLPDVNVPEFPEIPGVDLGPVIEALGDVRQRLAEKEQEVVEVVEERPKRWTFKIDRYGDRPDGFIKGVEAIQEDE